MYSRHTSTRETERDRSPSRGSDRRASISHGTRITEDANSAALSREPPRGPKALDAARGHGIASSRGRSFQPRGDYRDRERDRERDRDREFRGREPSSFGRREDHRSDWARRDRDINSRDGRTFQNRRSRSPSVRDRRDSRFSPPASLEASRSHRDPKDGPALASTRSQESSSSWSSRGGSYRGWGRGDYDRGRGRGSFPESDTYRTRSRSREPWRERDARDERDRYSERDSDLDRRERFDRRDTERLYEREDRERDLFPIKRERPPSRNSVTGGPSSTVTTPAANSTTSSTLDKISTKAIADLSRRYSATTPTATKRETDRGDYFSLKQEPTPRGQLSQRAVSPPPAPQVPAFGAPLDFSNSSKKAASAPDGEGIRAQAVPKGPLKPVSVSAHSGSAIQPPTGPKAERDQMQPGSSRDVYFTPAEPRNKSNLQAMTSRTASASVNPLRAGSDSSEISPRMSEKRVPQGAISNSSRLPQATPTGPKAGPQSSGVPVRIPTDPVSPANSQFAQTRPSNVELTTRGPPLDAPRGPKERTSGKQLSIQQPVAKQFSNKQWVSPAYQQSLSLNKSTLSSAKVQPETFASAARPSSMSDLGTVPLASGPLDAENLATRKEIKPSNDQSTNTQENGSAQPPELTMNFENGTEKKAMANLEAHQPSEDEGDEDEDLGLNEEDFAESERRYQREREALLARRPLSPLKDPQVINHLLKLQLLQILSTGDLPATLTEANLTNRDQNVVSGQAAKSPQILDFLATENLPFGRPLRQLRQSPGNAIPTPPMEDLPFIDFDSRKFPQDLWCPDRPPEDTDGEFIKQLWRVINKKREIDQNYQEDCKAEFRQRYKAWRMQVADLDRKKHSEKPLTPAPASPPLSVAPTLAPTPIVERTRGAKNMTELDFQNILKESEHTAREEQERRDRGSNAKRDPDKEALIPDMLSESERESAVFEDTGHLIPPDEVLDVFDFVPLEDDFSEEEQKIFTEAYVTWPKKWGRIAESLPGRDFQQCIIHYYLTKQVYKYKDLVRKNQGRRGRRAKGPTTRPKSNALMADLGVRPDVYEGDEFDAAPAAVTDTGRPRRAAAPTFGETGPDTDAGLGAATRQRGGQVSTRDGAEPSAEKPTGRGRKMGPKTSRKPKGQQQQGALPVPTGPSPSKIDREAGPAAKPPRSAPKLDPMPLKAAENQGLDVQRPVERDLERSRKLPIAPATAEGENPLNSGFQVYQQPHQPSSYWSVYEVRDFPRLLAHFGRDFEGISTFMRTKTAIMVKNYFVRQIENGKTELERIATTADEKKQRGEPMGPPPPPAIPPKRKYDISSSAATQRPLAPSTDTVDSEDGMNVSVKPNYSEERSPPTHHNSPPSALLANPPRTSQVPPVANRVDDHIRPQNAVQSRSSQGPRIGFFSEERREARPPSTAQMVPQQPGSLQLLSSQPPEKPRVESSRHQTILPQRQNIAPQPAHQSPNQFPPSTVPISQPPFAPSVSMPQSGAFGPAPHIRNHNAHSAPQSITVKQEPDVGLGRHQENQPQLRPFKASPVESPVSSRPPTALPLQKENVNTRSNPVPAPPPASEPPRAAPAKRSNLMSLLNDEPVDPQPSKRISADPAGSAGKTPSVQSPSTTFYSQQPQPLPGNQQFSRREEAPLLQHQQPHQHLSYKTHVSPIQMHPPPTIQPAENRDFRDIAGYSGSPAPGPANRDWINRFDPRMSQHHTPPSGTPDPTNRGQQVPLSPYSSTSAPTHQTTLMAHPAPAQPSSGSQYHRMTVTQPSILPANPSPPPQPGQSGSQMYRPSSTSQQHGRMPSYGQHPPLHVQTSNVSSGHPHSAPSSAIPSMHRQPSLGYDTRPIPAPQSQGFAHQQPQLQQPHPKLQQHHSINTHNMGVHPLPHGKVGNEYPTQPGRIYTPPGQAYGLYQQQSHHRQYSQGGGEERR